MTLPTNQSDSTAQNPLATPEPTPDVASKSTAPGRGLMVLPAVLLVVLLGVAATFVAYKISNDQRVAEQQSRIEALKRDLKAKDHELDTAKEDLDAADECLSVVRDLLNSPDEDSARRSVRLMVVKCGD